MSRQEFCRVVNDTYLLDNGERKPGKDGQMRTYDRDGFRRRAGCVIFRNAEETEVGDSHSLCLDFMCRLQLSTHVD